MSKICLYDNSINFVLVVVIVIVIGRVVVTHGVVVVADVFSSRSLEANLKFNTGSAANAHNLMGFLVKSFKWMTGLPSRSPA